MVVVTGTKRSGTSLWMRMLIEAGLPHLGEAFPSVWEESIRDANPNGFYESSLRMGVFFGTNPNPKTGQYLTSGATQHHVVKIFIPGVVRTELAYLSRVVGTMRYWRAYSRSIDALYAQEDAYLMAHPRDGKTGEQLVSNARARRLSVPHPVAWFLENYELMRDFAVRRYPINFCAYEKLLAEPEPIITEVFHWLGHGDVGKALSVIDTDLKRSNDRPSVDCESLIDPKMVALFDDFYGVIHDGSAVPRTLLEPLNQAWKSLSRQYARLDSRRVADESVGITDDNLAHR